MFDLDEDELLLYGGLAVGALLLWRGRQIVATVVDFVGRGERLTVTELDANGNIPDDPQDLAAAAAAVMGRDVSADTYALARMARSEGIDAGVLRVHVALNDLADLNDRRGFGWSALDLITYATTADARGHFGEQLGRRYASTRDPYQSDVVLVEGTIAEHQSGIDPTAGAIKFVDQSSFGVQPGTGTYADLVAKWAKEGLQPSAVPGYSDDFVVFRRVT